MATLIDMVIAHERRLPIDDDPLREFCSLAYIRHHAIQNVWSVVGPRIEMLHESGERDTAWSLFWCCIADLQGNVFDGFEFWLCKRDYNAAADAMLDEVSGYFYACAKGGR